MDAELAWAMVADRLTGTVELLADGQAVTVVAPADARPPRWWRRRVDTVSTVTLRRRGDAYRVEVPGAGTTRDLGSDRTAAVDLVLRTLRDRPGGVADPARVVVGRPGG